MEEEGEGEERRGRERRKHKRTQGNRGESKQWIARDDPGYHVNCLGDKKRHYFWFLE